MKQFTLTKKLLVTLIIIFIASTSLIADPPDPPVGKVWVLNHEMSDEFDANSPNLDKWKVFDKGDSWDRTSAFDKRVHEAVKDPASDNYFLTMNPMWYYEDERFTSSGGRTYNFAGGGMDTKVLQTYGYFEIRIRPSDFPMGSGVFMNSRGTTSGSCNEKYATELDIIENMGYTGPGAGSFNNYQHVNSHVKPYSDASGSCQRLPYETTNSGVSGKLLDEPLGFNTVGVWWKDESTAEFFNNDKSFGTITPRRTFYLPMPIILTMETYGWGSDENNATNPKPVEWMFEDDFRSKEQRAVTYDWVRVWKLVDLDDATFNDTLDNIKCQNESVDIYPGRELGTTFFYAVSDNREIIASVYNPSGTKMVDTTYIVSKGVRSIYTQFVFESDLVIAEGYKAVFSIMEGETVLISDTSIINVIDKPLEKKLWCEGIPSSLPPGKSSYSIDVKYETDVNSTVVIEIRKPDGSWFGGGSTDIVPGNGVATVNANASSATSVASNYFYKVYMHGKGLDWRDPNLVSISPTIYFNVENPIEPSINLISVPTEIMNNANTVDVEFQYETNVNGILEILLINPIGEIVAIEKRTERIGNRSLTRTIDIDSVLSASPDYKLKIQFSPEDDSFELLSDSVEIAVSGGTNTSLIGVKNKDQSIHLFPNPASKRLNVELASTLGRVKQIEVHSIIGKKMNITDINLDNSFLNFDVSSWPVGTYLLKVVTDDKVLTRSFTKSK